MAVRSRTAEAGAAAAAIAWPPQPGGVTGHHWLLDASDCRAAAALLEHVGAAREACLEAVRRSGMTVVGDAFHQFSPVGVTGTVLLAESHLSIHTWPESRFATADVYVCNHRNDNHDAGRRLVDALLRLLEPGSVSLRYVERHSERGQA